MDVTWLAPVLEATGPFATVHLDVSRTDEAGAHEVELRWRAARSELADAGAPDDVLRAMDDVVTAAPSAGGPTGRTVVATADGVLLERAVPGLVTGRTVWGPAPDLLPLLRHLGDRPPYVLAIVDRVGADIEVWGPSGAAPRSTDSVDGGTLHIRKVKVGAWAHNLYQHRSENLWRDNAKDVARRLDELVARTGAGVVAVAGDRHMATILTDQVGDPTRERIVLLEHGGRAAGAARESLDTEVDALLAKQEAAALSEVLESYRQERGQHDRAVEGLAATCEALRRAQVDTLLLAEEQLGDARLYTGSQPVAVAVAPEDMAAMGEQGPTLVPAAAALLRAAAATDAGVVTIPSGAQDLADGVAALLRYADDSTPS